MSPEEIRDHISAQLASKGEDHTTEIRNGAVLVHIGSKTYHALETDDGLKLCPLHDPVTVTRSDPTIRRKRHAWEFDVPHHATCKRCGLQKRMVWFPGGFGTTEYYDQTGTPIGSQAPGCEPITDAQR